MCILGEAILYPEIEKNQSYFFISSWIFHHIRPVKRVNTFSDHHVEGFFCISVGVNSMANFWINHLYIYIYLGGFSLSVI